jgi:hypothetical protein
MVLRALVAILLLAAWRGDVYATTHPITTCKETCKDGEQCILSPPNGDPSLSCATNPAVTVNTGADLDFMGHTIICSGCSSTAVGVVVTDPNSTVEDTVGGGGLRGYPTGIDCNYANNSLVRKVHVDNANKSGSIGITGCRKIQSAVVTNAYSYGIVNLSIGDSDYIKDSYIEGAYGSGFASGTNWALWLGGSGSGLIDHNVIGNTRLASFLFDGTSALTVSNNMLFNQTVGFNLVGFSNGGRVAHASGNVCGDISSPFPSTDQCSDCIQSGICEAYFNTPFVVP